MFKIRFLRFITAVSFILTPAAVMAQDKSNADGTLCLLVIDLETGKNVHEEGLCNNRYTPASTFKIPLAVMGFESNFLKNQDEPVLNYKKGEPDWGGKNWTGSVTPTSWMQYSVVWYSQRIAHKLGEQALHDYAERFHYGNADFSGDKNRNNGLDRAWIASSLQVSPREQTGFLRNLLLKKLPVSHEAQEKAVSIVQKGGVENGWEFYGKTGMAYPRNADYTFNYANPYGWYVGWASKDSRRIVFAALRQDLSTMEGPASARAKRSLETFLSKLP